MVDMRLYVGMLYGSEATGVDEMMKNSEPVSVRPRYARCRICDLPGLRASHAWRSCLFLTRELAPAHTHQAASTSTRAPAMQTPSAATRCATLLSTRSALRVSASSLLMPKRLIVGGVVSIPTRFESSIDRVLVFSQPLGKVLGGDRVGRRSDLRGTESDVLGRMVDVCLTNPFSGLGLLQTANTRRLA